MLSLFQQYIRENRLILPGERLLVAVSGGVDSVLLARFCHASGYSVTLVHCNFHLRGEESDRDEAFVRALAEELKLPLLVRSFQTEELAAGSGKGIQELARDLRYGWFRELIEPGPERIDPVPVQTDVASKPIDPIPELTGPVPEPIDPSQPTNTSDAFEPADPSNKPIAPSRAAVADIVLTAHHADDNIETLLMNFFRGTGLNGLGAMDPRNGRLVRPLLFARKADLLAYAKENGIAWVEDSSNLSDKYTRNYFRHTVLPALKDIYPQVEHNLLENIRRFRDTAHIYRIAVEKLRAKLVQQQGKNLAVPVLLLSRQPGLHTLAYELFSPYGFSAAQTGEIVQLLDARSGRYVSSATHRVIRHRNWLLIAEKKEDAPGIRLLEAGEEWLTFGENVLRARMEQKKKDWAPLNDPRIAQLNAAELRFPLIVRPWRAGDYFYPLGMRKKKKISRFLIDMKVPIPEKEKVYVLETGGRIAWVIGYRMDDRFRIGDGVKEMLTLSYNRPS